MDANNLSISGWYRNAQSDGTPEAVGIAGNANYMVGANHNVFLRGGWNNGSLFRGFLTGGFAWRPPGAPSDLFGAGFGWASPTNPPQLPVPVPPGVTLRDQYTWEVFYRFHVTPNLAVTPDFQWIVDPTLTPAESHLFAFGLRTRLTF
jgi:carbohydrate-selective porin OprB